MPRGPRDDAPGTAHHVMVRGIARGSIFLDDADRREFLRRLAILVPELGFRCFAFALIPNHAHLLVRSSHTKLSVLMARLGTGYAHYFNRRHDRVGHLFQNRFRSRRVVDDGDLMGLVRYVCLNPLEHGIVRDATGLERYPWWSVGALLGSRRAEAFESVTEALALFDEDVARARASIRSWLGVSDCETAAEALPLSPVPPPRRRAPPTDAALAALVREVCARSGVSEAELRSRRRSKRIADARAMLVARAATELALSGSEMARAFGATPSGISRMLERAARRSNPSTIQRTSPL